ncbi:MAG: type 4a pilus biogenesis protein PilO [Solirubrobacterales bacterium]
MNRSSSRMIVSILVVVGVAIAFWMLVIAPKRKEADRLGTEVQQLTSSVEVARGEVAAATAAKESFPADYRQLVVLGQAAPAGDETASLLVELEALAVSSGVEFKSIQLSSSGGEAAAAAAPAPATPEPAETGSPGAVQAAATVPATELAASLLPLGASVGPAGLYVMPYTLEFSGGYFQITNFISKVDALVQPGEKGIAVRGRLITIGGFSLESGTDAAEGEGSGSELSASLTVTSYLSPPGQGVTAGATPSAPGRVEGESATTVSTPEASPPGPEEAAAK